MLNGTFKLIPFALAHLELLINNSLSSALTEFLILKLITEILKIHEKKQFGIFFLKKIDTLFTSSPLYIKIKGFFYTPPAHKEKAIGLFTTYLILSDGNHSGNSCVTV